MDNEIKAKALANIAKLVDSSEFEECYGGFIYEVFGASDSKKKYEVKVHQDNVVIEGEGHVHPLDYVKAIKYFSKLQYSIEYRPYKSAAVFYEPVGVGNYPTARLYSSRGDVPFDLFLIIAVETILRHIMASLTLKLT